MSQQIIEAINTPSVFQFEGDTAELRLYPTQSFLTSTGQMMGQGSPWNTESWYLPVTCDVQPTGILYVPSFEIPSTTDGQPRTSKYVAALFDEGGAYVGPFPLMNPNGFAVPPTSLMPSPTWGQLQIYNRLPTLLYPPQTFPTRDEMYAAIAEAISDEWVRSSATVVGATALSVDPTSPVFPIALGINDPSWLELLATILGGRGFYFLSNYASLAAAVTDIGVTRATLLIDSVAAVALNLTIPANITLFFTNAGGIQPANSVTVTVLGSVTAPPFKIFYNALSGQGTIAFTANKVLTDFYPEWWGAGIGLVAATNATAMNACLTAIATGISGTMHLATGTYSFDATLVVGSTTGGGDGLGSFTTINIAGTSGLVGTSLSWAGATNLPVIKITRGRFNHFTDFRLTNAGVRGTTVGVLETGPAVSMQTHGTHYERVSINGFGKGIESGDASFPGGTASEMMLAERVEFVDCTYGWYASSNFNSLGFTFISCVFQGSDYGIYTTTGYQVTLTSCGGGQNDVDIHVSGNGNVLNVNGWDSEQSVVFLELANDATARISSVTLRSYTQTTANSTGIIYPGTSFLSIDGLYQGPNGTSSGSTGPHLIILQNAPPKLVLKDIYTTDAYPFFLNPGDSGGDGTYYSVENCRVIDNTSAAVLNTINYERGRVVWPGKLSNEILLQSTKTVDMNTATATTLFTNSTGRTCVITKVIVRNASTSLTTASYSFGWNSAAFDDVIANATHTELTGSTLQTILLPKAGQKLGASAGTFKVLMNTLQGGAATATMDVYGYFAS